MTLKKKMIKRKKIGKPLKYTPKSLQAVIDKYFQKAKEGEYTVTGLALDVGSKQLIQDYEKREEYREIIWRAKLRVENDYELSMRRHSRAGDIFGLKNFGWTDSRVVSIPELSRISDSELDQKIDAILAAQKEENEKL